MINKRNVNQLIPKAIEALEKIFNIQCGSEKDTIPNEYRNYLASFGTCIRTSGLKTAVAIYNKEGKLNDEDKGKVIELIAWVLDKDKQKLIKEINAVNSEDEKNLKQKVIEAAIAIKLSLNMFQLVDKEKKSN